MKLFIFFFFLFSSFFLLQARIWRVDNISRHNADFSTLQSAHNGASSGDTLYIAGTDNNYGNCTFTKSLKVIGVGYFLDENPDTQARVLRSRVNRLTFNNGSEGSIISGLSVQNIVISADFITISKCVLRDYSAFLVAIYANYTTIKQCFIQHQYTGSASYAISIADGVGGNSILNNYLYARYPIGSPNSSGNIISNNVINTYSATNDAITSDANTFRNNILVEGDVSGTDNFYFNNISHGSHFGTADGNQANVDMSTVFLGYPEQGSFTTDGRWQLAAGSPAIGSGENGVDCGIFGGSNPYVLSGLPNIPAIFFFSAPDSSEGASTLPVQLQGKVHR